MVTRDCRVLQPKDLDEDTRNIQRQAFAGLLWSKQFYHYGVDMWLQGDPAGPPPPSTRRHGRNAGWKHLVSRQPAARLASAHFCVRLCAVRQFRAAADAAVVRSTPRMCCRCQTSGSIRGMCCSALACGSAILAMCEDVLCVTASTMAVHALTGRFAGWDLAFHTIPLSLVDPEWSKRQLLLMLREWYMHPSGQMAAYEWNFGDVNPPVHAWACFRVYQVCVCARACGRRDPRAPRIYKCSASARRSSNVSGTCCARAADHEEGHGGA
jgi:hypothetical protein